MKKQILFLLLFFIGSSLFAQQFGTGLSFNDEAYEKIPVKATLTRSLYDNLPASASLKRFAPTPKSQGSYGTCTSWATAYAAMSIIENQKKNITNRQKIDANPYSPPFVYRLISTDYTCQSGTYIDKALEIMKTKGVPAYSEYHLICAGNVPADLYPKARKTKIRDYARIFGANDNSTRKIAATKKSLSQNKPVVIGMSTPRSFYKAKNFWQPTESYTVTYGGHAMCVVGYDDNKYGGAFEIQNSWGTNWGNNGYIWIKYRDYANFVKYAFELMETPIRQANQYDLAGSIRMVLANGNEMKARLKNNTYRLVKPYKSGTRFRIYLSNSQPAFVYAFGSDFTSQVFQIFPHNQYVSAALSYKQNDVPIPDEDHYIEMDNTVGTDYLCVLYSTKPLNIAKILKRVKSAYGTFQQKVESVVSVGLVAKQNVKYDVGSKIGFKARSGGKNIVALFIETEHIK